MVEQGYLVFVVISGYFYPVEGTPEPGEIHLVHFTPTFLSTFPVQIFAFTCAQNVSFQSSSRPALSFTLCGKDFPNLQRVGPQYPKSHEPRHRHINRVLPWNLRDDCGVWLPYFRFKGSSKRLWATSKPHATVGWGQHHFLVPLHFNLHRNWATVRCSSCHALVSDGGLPMPQLP